MAGGSLYQDDSGEAITEINVTPFVDVALVLLVIFMVTARMLVARGVEVDKPKAATGSEVKSTLMVTIDAKKTLYVNGQPYFDAPTAIARLKVLAAASQDEARAIIAGDAGVPYGEVMRAIDLVKAAGIDKIALANDPLAAPGAPR